MTSLPYLHMSYPVVDNALQVIDEYQIKINNYERDILLKPNMKTVKQCM